MQVGMWKSKVGGSRQRSSIIMSRRSQRELEPSLRWEYGTPHDHVALPQPLESGAG